MRINHNQQSLIVIPLHWVTTILENRFNLIQSRSDIWILPVATDCLHPCFDLIK